MMHRICEHIGEAYLPDFERFPESAQVQTHLAWEGQVGAMTSASVGKWKHATGDAQRSVEALMSTPGAKELLAELGYLDAESSSA